MNEEINSSVEPVGDTEMDTTPPNPAVSDPPPPQGKWEMPKPVFRKTSGRDPQSFVPPRAPVAQDPVPAAAAANDGHSSEAPPAEAVVEPQPQISEEITLESDEANVPASKERSPVVRAILILGVLLVIAGFIALFLFVVYFLFLTPAAETAF